LPHGWDLKLIQADIVNQEWIFGHDGNFGLAPNNHAIVAEVKIN